jgi:hypothetical protein
MSVPVWLIGLPLGAQQDGHAKRPSSVSGVARVAVDRFRERMRRR